MRRLIAIACALGCNSEKPHHVDKLPSLTVAVPATRAHRCQSESDCAQIPSNWHQLSCGYTCIRTDGAADGFCRFKAMTAQVGAGPCFGNRLGVVTEERIPADATVVFECDIDAGAYCGATGRCEATEPIGAACDRDQACGKDGTCDDGGHCVPAPRAGARCVLDRCTASTYCDDNRTCQPLHARGDTCTETMQCATRECRIDTGDFGHCVDAAPELACPYAVTL